MWSAPPRPAPPAAHFIRNLAHGTLTLICKRCSVGLSWQAGAWSAADEAWFMITHAEDGSAHAKKARRK